MKHFDGVSQTSFGRGEYLEYKVSYGLFDAAKATLEIKPESQNNGENNAYCRKRKVKWCLKMVLK